MWYLAIPPIISITAALMSGSPLMGVVLFLLLALCICPGIFLVGVPFLGRPLTRARTGARLVALTFDDGPHPVHTRAILDALKARGARATFFVTAENARKHPGLVRAAIDEGHQVENHSTSHRHVLSLMPYRSQYNDILAAQQLIGEIAGVRPLFYRPPMGYKTPDTFRAASRIGLTVCAWDVKGLDTVITDPEHIARRVVSGSRAGSVILLHDSGSLKQTPDDRSATVRAVPLILAGLAEKGLRPVTVSELFSEEKK